MDADFYEFRAHRVHDLFAVRSASHSHLAGVKVSDRVRLEAIRNEFGIFLDRADAETLEHVFERLARVVGRRDLAVAKREFAYAMARQRAVIGSYRRVEKLAADRVASFHHGIAGGC